MYAHTAGARGGAVEARGAIPGYRWQESHRIDDGLRCERGALHTYFRYVEERNSER